MSMDEWEELVGEQLDELERIAVDLEGAMSNWSEQRRLCSDGYEVAKAILAGPEPPDPEVAAHFTPLFEAYADTFDLCTKVQGGQLQDDEILRSTAAMKAIEEHLPPFYEAVEGTD